MRGWITSFIAFAAIAVSGAAQAENTVFDIDMMFTYDRLTPELFPGINNRVHLTVTLSGANTVNVDRTRRISRFTEGRAFETTLGAQGPQGGGWRVVNASTLQATRVFPQSTRTITLRVHPDKSCSVESVDRLKPGFREYKFRRIDNGQMALFTQPRLVSSSCTVR